MPDREDIFGVLGINQTIWDDITDLASYSFELINFIQNPLRFLRKRIAPLMLGAIFELVFNLGEIIRRPFEAIVVALQATGGSFENAFSVTFSPLNWVLRVVIDSFVALSEPFGALQPFVLGALIMAFVYLMLVIGLRLLRAVLDSVPGLSGVETFLFG
jgi:hypothetical protein